MRARFLSLYLFILLTLFGTILVPRVLAFSQDDISVSINPGNPAPNENVTITLSSYAANLDGVLITWSIAGKNTLSGIGKKSFSLSAPVQGKETDVMVTLAFPDGDVKKIIVIKPSIMVMLWQADDSYVPPFYKGKAMPTPDSEVKVVAMPEIKNGGKMVDPNNMVYAWQKDYSNDPSASGYGKNFYTYSSDYLDSTNTIDVTASTTDGIASSEASITIGTSLPKIIFYKNDANLGTIWELAVSDGYKVQGPQVLEADPYFISPKDIKSPILTWDWSINDSPISITGGRKNLIPLQTQAGTSGSSKISLEINNILKIFETASKSINVQF